MRKQSSGAGGVVIWIFLLMFVGWGGSSAFANPPVTCFFAPPDGAVSAGSRVSLWLNVLNTSNAPVAWSFPPQWEVRLSGPGHELKATMDLQDPAADREVIIAPGTFVRREYALPLPLAATGQVVVAFAPDTISRLMLDVQSARVAAPETVAPVTPRPESTFTRLFKEVEPETPANGFEPEGFFKEHISGYEPFYFIAGTKSPNAKFQISFKYQLLNKDGPLAAKVPALKGFHVAYTQLSLWDWNGPSAPFYDSSYKPELMYSWEGVLGGQKTNWYQLDLQGGLKHESNGKGGTDSRSLNIAYFEPTLTLGTDDGLQLTLQPRTWVYLGDLSDNPDMAEYRGYIDLRAIVGWKRGLQLSALGRMGQSADHGGLQLDLTYPTMRIFGSFSVYLHAQYFVGYGESLLAYNQTSESFRIGFSLYR